MNKIERWFLERSIRRACHQGGHDARIISLYRMIWVATRDEFSEDNEFTRNSFLQEQFNISLTGNKE